MRYFSTMKAARGALALDTGFDPFISGGWGRCTLAKLADAGYAVDEERVEEEAEMRFVADRQRKADESQRSQDRRDWAARPRTRKYAAAAKLLGGGSLSMIEIGENLAHVTGGGRYCVVELVDNQFVARLPLTGEKIYV